MIQKRPEIEPPCIEKTALYHCKAGLKAFLMEVGDKDGLIRDDTWMHEELDGFGVPHEWKVFDGDHGNRVSPRFRSDLLPFFRRHLEK